ncbi:MAG: DUF2071 domain-containing protein [Deinococcales bacterium]
MKHSALLKQEHRPWPIPKRPWTWRQSWQDLLFAHWPISASVLRPLVPPALKVQEFEGTAWIGVVPFRMAGVMRRPLPDLPWLSAFPELNVRIYVEEGGKAGVWFLSLDAANPVAVWAARRFFHLPYFYAEMSVREEGARIKYASQREGAGFLGEYGPISEVYGAGSGGLEHFLTERYCLYALAPNGKLYRNEVHHVPWSLQKAEANIQQNTMLNYHGINIKGPPPLLHFAKRIDVVVWDAELVSLY